MITPTPTGLKSVPLEALLKDDSWAGWRNAGGGIGGYYATVPWLHRGVNLIAQALADVPKSIHAGGAEGDELPEDKLPVEIDLSALLDQMGGDLVLYGAAYVVVSHTVMGRPAKVAAINAASVLVQYDVHDEVDYYEWQFGSYAKRFSRDRAGRYRAQRDGQHQTASELLIPVWLPNRTRLRGPGVSPAASALAAAGVLANMDTFTSQYFANGALFPVLVSIDETATESDTQRIQAWYKRMLTGIRNAFRLEVVRGKVSATQIGYPLRELAADTMTGSKREDIATALGVPQSLLFSNAANYAVARQDDIHFYSKSVLPLGGKITSALNKALFKALGCWLVLHPERLEVYQRQENEKATAISTLYSAGIMGLVEAREKVALPAELPADLLPRQAGALAQPGTAPATARPLLAAEAAAGEDEAADNSDSATLEDDEVSKMLADWRKWARLAEKRMREKRPAKAAQFESAAIPASLAAAVRGCLTAAETVEDVRLIFAQGEA